MVVNRNKYCLDANVLIQAWQKYYSPSLCPDYWKILDSLGLEDTVFIPSLVFEEITRTEDDLATWLKSSHIPVRGINEQVTKHLQGIYAAHPNHKYLVDNVKGRSLADPWVIAHAIDENAIVVTKEEKITALNKKKNKIKIPDVCKNMQVRCINDFQLINELGIRFSCEVIS